MTESEAFKTCFDKPYIVPVKKHEEAKSTIKKSLDEIRQYRELGTVEELRIAKTKQVPKKVKTEQWIYTKCDCGYEFSKHHGDGYYSIPLENKTKYCPNCGQKIDFGE